MGYEEMKNHLLSLSYEDLQCLCKRYNLPAKKTHSQLASLLASLLQVSPPAATTVPLATVKETATCDHVSNKRGPYNGRDDGRQLPQVKHQKGSQRPVNETTKGGIDTGTSICPVSINHGRPDCHGRSSYERGAHHNLQSPSDLGIASKSANPGLDSKHHRSPDNIIDQICPLIVEKHPEASTPFSHTEDTTVKCCGPSDKMSANAPAVQFSVMSDEGIDLVVDLNSTPASWAKTFMAEMCITPPEPGNFSSFISSLATKDDHSTASPSGNIIVDIQSKGAVNIIPSTNLSRASDVGENSLSVRYPTGTITVNSVSSTSTLAGTPVELSGYHEGAPVVSSSCLTADVQNNVTSEPSALDNEALLPESANVFMQSERITVPLHDASMQPTGNKVTMIPDKTKVFGKICCTQNVSFADTDNFSTFSSGGVVRSVSNEDSCPKSSGKQTADVPAGVQQSHNDDIDETLMENEPGAVAVEEDIGCGDSLSISCQLAGQTVAKLPVTDAQSHASSADHCVAGSFDLAHPTSSSAASDNAINSLTSKCGAESAQSHGSTDKNRVCGVEGLEELESMSPAAYSEPPRNIQLSLRSASAKKKPSTLPRRSARLIPK